jgi:hypothetical protein
MPRTTVDRGGGADALIRFDRGLKIPDRVPTTQVVALALQPGMSGTTMRNGFLAPSLLAEHASEAPCWSLCDSLTQCISYALGVPQLTGLRIKPSEASFGLPRKETPVAASGKDPCPPQIAL